MNIDCKLHNIILDRYLHLLAEHYNLDNNLLRRVELRLVNYVQLPHL